MQVVHPGSKLYKSYESVMKYLGERRIKRVGLVPGSDESVYGAALISLPGTGPDLFRQAIRDIVADKGARELSVVWKPQLNNGNCCHPDWTFSMAYTQDGNEIHGRRNYTKIHWAGTRYAKPMCFDGGEISV